MQGGSPLTLECSTGSTARWMLILVTCPNFRKAYLTHTMSKLYNLSGVGKISPRDFQPYQDLPLNPSELGVMAVGKWPKLTFLT
uniref:Uncharacterized protein n=1 Tax=Solanum tuberosum TaxID=4113 RepID=M1E105_SOLTU